jgi:hypothetical protein
MQTERSAPLHVVILGTDAVLAARPAEPIQLARACMRAGFDFVAPVSWGEELLASRIADVIEARRPAAVVVANCPFVAESMRAASARTRIIASVSPPVATSRYVRAAFPDRAVHVTYVGACPGATAPDIDKRMGPELFLAGLIDSGIDVTRQPCHLDGQLPADRSRHASVPGGIPDAVWLAERTEARTLEAAPTTVDAIAATDSPTVVLDLGVACGCACAELRAAAMRLDPPRSPAPVVLPISLPLADHRRLPAYRLVDLGKPFDPEQRRALLADRLRDQRATFVARGLSDVNVTPLEPLTGHSAAALEPRSSVSPAPARGPDRHAANEPSNAPSAERQPSRAVEPTPHGR